MKRKIQHQLLTGLALLCLVPFQANAQLVYQDELLTIGTETPDTLTLTGTFNGQSYTSSAPYGITMKNIPNISWDNGNSNPFTEEGKTWHMKHYNAENPDLDPKYKYTYFIKGDTVISDLNCKKLYSYNKDNDRATNYVMALLETGGKVYFVPRGDTGYYLLYDFYIPVGTSAVFADATHPEQETEMRNLGNWNVTSDGIRRRYSVVNRGQGEENASSVRWIEGIGSELGPLSTWQFEAAGNNDFLLYCDVNGQRVFTLSDMEAPSTVSVDGSPHRVIRLEQAGTLEDISNEWERMLITDLKLSGPLNGTDIAFINGIRNLEWLDLEEAYIVSGGEAYMAGEDGTPCYTTDRTLDLRYFTPMRSLRSITLPAQPHTVKTSVFPQNLERIVCKADVPPTCDADAFTQDVPNGLTLYVPLGSKSAYAGADGWKELTDLIGTRNELVSVCVDNAGTLADLIADEEKNLITRLKVTGPINGDDIRLLRDMAGLPFVDFHFDTHTQGQLAVLDLKDAVIKAGGGAYKKEDGIDSEVANEDYTVSYYTEDNKLSEYVFMGAPVLREIHIPVTVTEIQPYAFDETEHPVDVFAYSLTPPACTVRPFEANTLSHSTLHVPSGAKAAYQAAEGWKDFHNIVEDTETGITVSRTDRPAKGVEKTYTIDGLTTKAARKGIYIMQTAGGHTKKVLLQDR